MKNDDWKMDKITLKQKNAILNLNIIAQRKIKMPKYKGEARDLISELHTCVSKQICFQKAAKCGWFDYE
jgi:hypothetical protein